MTFTDTARISDNAVLGAPVGQADLVQMWQDVIRKARTEIPIPPVRPCTLNFDFDGGNVPITAATTGSLKLVIPYPCRILWARLCAGDANDAPIAVSATVRVSLTSFEQFGASSLLSGSGSMPTLASTSSRDCDLTGWYTNLQTGDWLIARLTSFVGLATWVSLDLLLRPTDAIIGSSDYESAASDVYTDADGNPYTFRG